MTEGMKLLSAVFCSDSVDAVKESEEKNGSEITKIQTKRLVFSQSGENRV
jgi:hypothetical protein